MQVDGFRPNSPRPECLARIIKRILLREQIHYTVLSHGTFYYVVGDTPEEPKEQKEQLNGIAFINQCHIMYSAHISSTIYKQKVYESFGSALAESSLVRNTIQAVL